jgi:hypothetical protein
MTRVAWLGGLAWLVPDPVAACATCTSSAFGDLSFTWPHLTLLLLPLVVAGVVGGVIIYCYRRARIDARVRPEPAASRAAAAPDAARPAPEGR